MLVTAASVFLTLVRTLEQKPWNPTGNHHPSTTHFSQIDPANKSSSTSPKQVQLPLSNVVCKHIGGIRNSNPSLLTLPKSILSKPTLLLATISRLDSESISSDSAQTPRCRPPLELSEDYVSETPTRRKNPKVRGV
ncbi:hypothetical protein RHMOL_Rhmol04G0361400 [Rhododendron molle]|uniref:Uncharacterized protein n=1 Tax=Rhododendron molle TaxID=49168 RepID=A0ACC0P967_RHOML|nr:hypothetical protein RHMOL_Rhmol04G0361400 [Rhododendron molle]